MARGELLAIESGEFALSIRGPVPSIGSYSLQTFPTCVASQASGRLLLDIPIPQTGWPLLRIECRPAGLRHGQVNIRVGTMHSLGSIEAYLPLFFETIDYQVQLVSRGVQLYTLWHEYSAIRSSLDLNDRLKVFSGRFTFGNNVGESTFELRVGDESHLIIQFTVFSLKVGFFDERFAMIEELSQIHEVLVQQLFQPTASYGGVKNRSSLGLEWISSFYRLSQDLVHTANRIEQKAHRRIQTQIEPVSPHKIRKPNRSLLRQLTRQGKNQVLHRNKVLIEQRSTQVNTSENRYLKFLLRRVAATGSRWFRYINDSDLPSIVRIRENELLLPEIARDLRIIQAKLNNGFWEAVGEDLPVLLNRTTFEFEQLFLRFEKLYRVLFRGVSVYLDGSRLIFTLSMDKLYELWTYCKLAGLTARLTGAEQPDIKVVNAFQATMRTGRSAQIDITPTISIIANWLITTNVNKQYFTPLVNQEPDLVFEIRHRGFLHVLDAKYRIEVLAKREGRWYILSNAELVTEDLLGDEIAFLAKDETINTIHRYKDAIQTRESPVRDNFSRSAVRTGVIVFPHRPMREDQYWRKNIELLGQFGIGAVPLCPGSKDEGWQENSIRVDDLIPDDNQSEQVRILAFLLRRILQIAATDPTA